jgi:hypothetical protein
VKRLLGRSLVAMYSGTNDVWELGSGATSNIEYDQTRRRRGSEAAA